jgi:hypothetical protein
MNQPAKDVTALTGDALFQALISDVPIVVDNRKARKKAKHTNSQTSAKGPKLNGKDARAELEKLTEEQRLRNIIRGLPDREWQPIAVVLMIQDTTCLTCGARTSAPFCEVPMLKIRRRRKDKSKATAYVRLDHRIPAIHAKLLRKIQHQHRFVYTCAECFEETNENSSPDERSLI